MFRPRKPIREHTVIVFPGQKIALPTACSEASCLGTRQNVELFSKSSYSQRPYCRMSSLQRLSCIRNGSELGGFNKMCKFDKWHQRCHISKGCIYKNSKLALDQRAWNRCQSSPCLQVVKSTMSFPLWILYNESLVLVPILGPCV